MLERQNILFAFSKRKDERQTAQLFHLIMKIPNSQNQFFVFEVNL